MAGNSITQVGSSHVPATNTTSTAVASGSTAPPQPNAVSVGTPAENPTGRTPIRTLPNEVKLAIVRQAHPQQSTTALAAALYAPDPGSDKRFDGQKTVIANRPLPADMSVTAMAKTIARSTHPNLQRDQFKTGRGRMHDPAVLHEDIDLLNHRANFLGANPFEKEQANALLHTDFDKLERLGKGTAAQDAALVAEIRNDIRAAVDNPNPNLHQDSAPSTSAACDALGIGLAVRLRELKGGQLDALRVLRGEIENGRSLSVWHGPAVLDGTSTNARMDMLSEMLKATGHLTSTPAHSEILARTIAALDSTHTMAGFFPVDQQNIAIAFGKAVPAFTRDKTGRGDHRHEISHMAMTEFRGLINGTPAYHKDGYVSSRQTVKFSRNQRAQIMGEVAASLAEKPARAGANAASNGVMKKMQPMLDSVKRALPGRTPVQTSMLNHMLDSLELPPRKKDTRGQNLFAGVENSVAWTGLLAVAPKLDKSAQKKIGNAFLKQIEKSRLLDLPQHEFTLAKTYRPNHATNNTSLSLEQCQGCFLEPYAALEKVLPDIKDTELAANLRASLDKFKSAIPQADRDEHFPAQVAT